MGHSPDEVPLDRLTRALDRATAAEQWDLAKSILRQIERLELARAGNVVALDVERARRGR